MGLSPNAISVFHQKWSHVDPQPQKIVATWTTMNLMKFQSLRLRSGDATFGHRWPIGHGQLSEMATWAVFGQKWSFQTHSFTTISPMDAPVQQMGCVGPKGAPLLIGNRSYNTQQQHRANFRNSHLAMSPSTFNQFKQFKQLQCMQMDCGSDELTHFCGDSSKGCQMEQFV